MAEKYVWPGQQLGAASIFMLGGVAGIITVYVTQPIDTIKTRMQGIDARRLYRNSLQCAGSLIRDEGMLRLWSGAVPRLGRLIFSGGIVFKSMILFNRLDPKNQYI